MKCPFYSILMCTVHRCYCYCLCCVCLRSAYWWWDMRAHKWTACRTLEKTAVVVFIVADFSLSRPRLPPQAAFEFLANDLVLPAVRSSLVNEWEVRDPTAALSLAESMVLAGVGDEVVQALLEQVWSKNKKNRINKIVSPSSASITSSPGACVLSYRLDVVVLLFQRRKQRSKHDWNMGSLVCLWWL